MSAHLKPTMPFEDALRLARTGKKVARKEWWKVLSGGKNAFQDWQDKGPCMFHHEGVGRIVFRNKQGWIVTKDFITHDDALADDWIEVE